MSNIENENLGIQDTKIQIKRVVEEVRKVIVGKDDCIRKVLTAILAGGHILIEDIPGVGKTTLALAFSKALELTEHRVQFTPDVLPTDITGFSMYQKNSGTFVYQEGSIMCNLFLADEINRTSPKTQSALLQVMEEGKVTVDGITREVPRPFIVIATQNPVGSSGTQMLPESQLDRFMICMTMGYPDIEGEIAIIKGRNKTNPLDKVRQILTKEDILRIQILVKNTYINDKIYDYIGKLIVKTRTHPLLSLGVSPRGTIALTNMAKASACLGGRDYVIPEDVRIVFHDVCAHRIQLSSKARMNDITGNDALTEILNAVNQPVCGKY